MNKKVAAISPLAFRGKADFVLEFGRTNGYVPDMRFVFDREKNNWELIYGKYKIPTE